MHRATTKWERFEWRYPYFAKLCKHATQWILAITVATFFAELLSDNIVVQIKYYASLAAAGAIVNANRS